MKFPFYKQHDTMDCGPTCIKMIARYYGKHYNLQTLRNLSDISREGVSFLGMTRAAEAIGFKTVAVKLDLNKLGTAPLPCIVHWRQSHFVIVYRITRNKVYVTDPGKGHIKYDRKEFQEGWTGHLSKTGGVGVALLFETTPNFYSREDEGKKGLNFSLIFQYLKQYRKLISQLVAGLLAGSLLQLIFPFLTQVIVDVGINTRDLNFIYLVLFAQLFLFLGKTCIEILRGWILLHISARVNISILSDFLRKLMKLPLSFFDTKMFGDILQRINDHRRIERFLTTSTLNVFFSFFNLIIFSIVLLIYSRAIFVIFFLGSMLYISWVTIFLKRRRSIDFKTFELNAKNQSAIVQLIGGMQEIKLNNCEVQKRWEWEHLQASLFRFNVQGLKLSQYQQMGGVFIHEIVNIFITFLSAHLVLNNQLSLGTMLAIQYIIGQLNNPVEQFVDFLTSVQDAKISLERMNEIHQFENEEQESSIDSTGIYTGSDSIMIQGLSFRYPGMQQDVLKNVSLKIPEKKVTAIVGASGSGKTTLIKLLLKFYNVKDGVITVDDTDLRVIRHSYWRSLCGAVLQDGFIFSDTIAGNIAVGEAHIDKDKLVHAARTANILSFIQSLPFGFNTRIGAEGNGISQGQKQRILIARAVYKNPKYLFFDEATNALDANNERTIMENLDEFFKGRTVIVVAHRLSTVKNADQIIVLNRGEIVERGRHDDLCKARGYYYELVKNQLELGNS